MRLIGGSMERIVTDSELIERIMSLEPSRVWVEPLIRGLGCACPDEVFDEIRVIDEVVPGVPLIIEVGRRLSVGFVSSGSHGDWLELLERGRALRDARGLNRFRLVVVGDVNQAGLEVTSGRALLEIDDRVHLHGMDVRTLETLLDGS